MPVSDGREEWEGPVQPLGREDGPQNCRYRLALTWRGTPCPPGTYSRECSVGDGAPRVLTASREAELRHDLQGGQRFVVV